MRGRRPRAQLPAPGPALPSVCMASSLCCTCWAIILLIPMRLSVMVLDVCARLSLVVFLKVQSGRRDVNRSLATRKPACKGVPFFNL